MNISSNFRKKDNLIQKLQNKDRQREDFLKRSADEVNRLRQQANQASCNSYAACVICELLGIQI